MNERIFIVGEAPVGGYIACALGASIFPEAGALDSPHEQACDAVQCHFEECQVQRIMHFDNLSEREW